MSKNERDNELGSRLAGFDQFTKEFAVSLSRRRFVKRVAVLGAFFSIGRIASRTVSAASFPTTTVVGPYALREGVTGYTTRQVGRSVEVEFTHTNPLLAGILRIHPGDENYAVVLELIRSRELFRIDFNLQTPAPYFTIQHKSGQVERFGFKGGKWQGERPDGQSLLTVNEVDAKIALAIFTDFDLGSDDQAKLQSIRPGTGQQRLESTALYCPCNADHTVRGNGTSTARSLACENAINDANRLCNNQWCWGCCGWIGQADYCDCGCGVGDYLCVCGKTGKYCYDVCS